MKGCDEYSANIQFYLDNELRGQDLEEFRAHLEECSACSEELRVEEELSSLLHRSRPLYSASDALRNRVIQAINEPLPSASYTPARLRNNILKVLVQPLRSASRRVHYWQALAAAVILVAAGLLLLPRMLQRARATSYIEAAMAAHRSYLDGRLPLEVQSDSPSIVTGWFAKKVPFTFRLPSSGEAAGQEADYKLTGGRLVNYRGEYAALVAYQMKREKISLLVASSKSAEAAGGEEIRSSGLVFHYNVRANFHIITWSNHGLTYALVSSLPGSGQQSCLVCHQNMKDSGHFTAMR